MQELRRQITNSSGNELKQADSTLTATSDVAQLASEAFRVAMVKACTDAAQ